MVGYMHHASSLKNFTWEEFEINHPDIQVLVHTGVTDDRARVMDRHTLPVFIKDIIAHICTGKSCTADIGVDIFWGNDIG